MKRNLQEGRNSERRVVYEGRGVCKVMEGEKLIERFQLERGDNLLEALMEANEDSVAVTGKPYKGSGVSIDIVAMMDSGDAKKFLKKYKDHVLDMIDNAEGGKIVENEMEENGDKSMINISFYIEYDYDVDKKDAKSIVESERSFVKKLVKSL